jgi:hypothetical protein
MSNCIPFTANALGDNVIIPADPNKPTIEIVELVFQCGAATTVQMMAGSGGGATPLTGPMPFTTGGNLNLSNNGQGPHLVVTGGADFVFNLSGTTGTCGGFVLYNQY